MRAGRWSPSPAYAPGPIGTRKYTGPNEPSVTNFGTQSPLFLEAHRPRLKTICCLRRVPERRRFSGGGSGSPVAWRLPARALQTVLGHVIAAGLTDRDRGGQRLTRTSSSRPRGENWGP